MSDIAGITIGPITETISNASSPAALWFASYFFSDITRRICQKIAHSDSFQNTIIYAPYYNVTDLDNDGVGKYNDRILFKAEQITKEALEKLIEAVKTESLNNFHKSTKISDTTKYLEQYLQIPFIILPYEENQTVDVIYSYLDTLEMMRTVPSDDRYSPFSSIFKGEENSKNKYVRESGLFKRVNQKQNQLQNFKSDEHIWRIEEIAAQKGTLLDHSDGQTENCKSTNEKKWPHYYVIVNADGDNLGSTLKTITFEKEGQEVSRVIIFNKACKENAEKAAEIIKNYGGMTIYAGGDDLLFIAPIIGIEGKSIFSLCDTLNNIFGQTMKENGFGNDESYMSMSFGISIQYYKFPLYEALENTRKLQSQAKKYGRNATALSLRKHSGQSIGFLFKNEYSSSVQDIIDPGSSDGGNSNDESLIITAISKTLLKYNSLEQILFNNACDSGMPEKSFIKIWLNNFDNPNQKVGTGNDTYAASDSDDTNTEGGRKNLYVETGKLFYNHFVKSPVKMSVFTDNNYISRQVGDSILSFVALLEFRKFMCEKEGKR